MNLSAGEANRSGRFSVDGAGEGPRSVERTVDRPDRSSEAGGVSAGAAEELIAAKRIGQRIKSLRQRKHMGLVELGRYTGLSASFLSQLETGRVVPTLRNLARIAMVFSRDLSFFFEPERPELFRILRRGERQRLPQSGVAEPGYFYESLGHVPVEQGVAPLVAEFLPGADGRSTRVHQHSGTEFLYVVSGELRLNQLERVETLSAGDAVYFDAGSAHGYQAVGNGPSTVLIITISDAVARNGTSTAATLPPASDKSEMPQATLRKSA